MDALVEPFTRFDFTEPERHHHICLTLGRR
jgi:hypothetical protein